ncbi:hemin uptake protein HemP [Paracoccus suum]|uniref:Hemin uptake protein HemP n=1 Tax=Paracoccus suum TaxID=2259340 RepID=A0A344PNJ4_9RHOB|nr:hemin uptake protein HemP [Paracoccus suum]
MTLHLDPRYLNPSPEVSAAMQQLPMGDALLPRHDARGLTAGGNLAAICLDGQTYTLRITRQGKLILTK